MQVILLGPPGAGKGTQAAKISASFNLEQLSTGDMLRKVAASSTELGKHINNLMIEGNLIPDATIIDMVQAYMSECANSNGYLFDGFPRTLAQAKSLTDSGISITHVINIDIDDSLIIDRLGGRRIHKSSGRTYHVLNNPPKQEGLDDITGEPLEVRKDDTPDAIRHRLEIFHKENNPIVSYYKELATSGLMKFYNLDGNLSIDDTTSAIQDILS